jgi:hypothetical protein
MILLRPVLVSHMLMLAQGALSDGACRWPSRRGRTFLPGVAGFPVRAEILVQSSLRNDPTTFPRHSGLPC